MIKVAVNGIGIIVLMHAAAWVRWCTAHLVLINICATCINRIKPYKLLICFLYEITIAVFIKIALFVLFLRSWYRDSLSYIRKFDQVQSKLWWMTQIYDPDVWRRYVTQIRDPDMWPRYMRTMNWFIKWFSVLSVSFQERSRERKVPAFPDRKSSQSYQQIMVAEYQAMSCLFKSGAEESEVDHDLNIIQVALLHLLVRLLMRNSRLLTSSPLIPTSISLHLSPSLFHPNISLSRPSLSPLSLPSLSASLSCSLALSLCSSFPISHSLFHPAPSPILLPLSVYGGWK